MSRNRKRAKERRARRPQGTAVSRGRATASDNGAPDPIAHATPDVELADAQLALGRPGPVQEDDLTVEAELEAEAEADESLLDDAVAADGGQGGGSPGEPGVDLAGAGPGPGGGGAAVATHRVSMASRLVGFLQGSWRELQRVQWPDRRQVVQATGVVLGFVIVAGVFLGVADLLAGHVVTLILNGRW